MTIRTLLSPGRARAATLALLLTLPLWLHTPAPATAAGPVTVRELPNGLTVIVEERPDALALGVTLTVRAGTRDDAPETAGAVALLARVLLSGTVTRPSPEQVLAPVEGTGGSFSFVVDADLTQFGALVPAGELETAIDSLADVVLHPRFGIVEVANALTEHVLEDVDESFDELLAALWPQHPAGRPPAGTEETLTAISFPDLLSLHGRYYTGRNMVLTIVGTVTAAEGLVVAERAFASLPAGERHPVAVSEPAAGEGGRKQFPSLGGLATVVMAFPTPGSRSPEYPVIQMLNLLLTGPDGLIFQDVRNDHGLARDVDAQTTVYTDVGAILAFARVQPANVDATLDRFVSVIERLRSQPVSEETLKRLRDRYAGELVLAREPALNRAAELGAAALLDTAADEATQAALARVTPEQVQQAAQRYLDPSRAVIQIYLPDFDG